MCNNIKYIGPIIKHPIAVNLIAAMPFYTILVEVTSLKLRVADIKKNKLNQR